jgi:hypothetical protein
MPATSLRGPRACSVLVSTGADERLNVDCATNAASTHFECYTTRSVHDGEELLAPYGGRRTRLRNSVLLTEYGFTMDLSAEIVRNSVGPRG